MPSLPTPQIAVRAETMRKPTQSGPGRPEPFPDRLAPMHAAVGNAPFLDANWLSEPKLDGYRILAFIRGNAVRLMSRRGQDYSKAFPSIVEQLRKFKRDCVLDGEIIAFGGDGKPSFQALQNRVGLAGDASIAAADRKTPAAYYCFDVLHYAGCNLRELPYVARRNVLARIWKTLKGLRKTSTQLQMMHADDDGVALYDAAIAAGFEGIVAKQKTSIYRPGLRVREWLKIKPTSSSEFVIGGYSLGKGSRKRFGSLVVGYWDDGKLRYAANVGTGYDEAKIDELLARFKPYVVAKSPFAEPVAVRAGTIWLKPELVAEVAFASWTDAHRLRAPVFLRLRDDIDPASVARTSEKKAKRGKQPVHPGERAKPGRTVYTDVGGDAVEIDGHSVSLSHLDRVYWPAISGQPAITKRDFLEYLMRMAPLMLPHLKDRPLTLFRWPEGIERRRVLEKHPHQALPSFVERATVFSETKGTDDVYLLCNNLASLLWLAERGTLELHVWHSRVKSGLDSGAPELASGSKTNLLRSIVNYPDYLLLDLDPYLYSGKETRGAEPAPNAAAFERTRDVAFWLKDLLDAIPLHSFVKTSGKTGLHVIVPVVRNLRFEEVRKMAAVICTQLLKDHGKDVTTEWDTQKRRGKVFLDFNMNVRGKSVIAPYCPRGLAGAPVSMPLSWKELERMPPEGVPMLKVKANRPDAWAKVEPGKQDLRQLLTKRRQ
jgi:bifunctional non-homologous end joining protein LigD